MRFGKKHQPTFRLVAMQARTKATGEALEYLGFYNPRTKPSTFEVADADRIKYWLGVGAQPTQTVAYLLSTKDLYPKPEHKFASKPGRKKQAQAAAKAAEASAS